jgi:drug/metabolite transporter (DMT)-like permease
MLYIFLSICCSVIVSIILRLAKRYYIDVYQAVTWNYSIAIILAGFFLKPQFHHLQASPFILYSILGLLLPVMFIALAVSVSTTGIVRTDVAQRLSLFIPITAAFLIFGEDLDGLRIAGIVLCFIAILFSIPWQRQIKGANVQPYAWLYLLLVFIGMGIVDVLFRQLALYTGVSSNTSLFVVFVFAFVFSIIGLIYQVARKKMKFSYPHILIGWVLGIVNFGNILFYIKAHQALARHPSVVFSLVNIGVIILGTLTGVFIFREKLSKLNIAGIVMAIIAIIIIFHPQYLTNLFSRIF